MTPIPFMRLALGLALAGLAGVSHAQGLFQSTLSQNADRYENNAVGNAVFLTEAIDQVSRSNKSGTLSAQDRAKNVETIVALFAGVLQNSIDSKSNSNNNAGINYVRALIYAGHDAVAGTSPAEQAKLTPLMITEANFRDAVNTLLDSGKSQSDFLADVKSKFPSGALAGYVNSVTVSNTTSAATGGSSASAGTNTSTSTSISTSTSTSTSISAGTSTGITVIPSTSGGSGASSSTLVAGPTSPGSTGGLSTSGAISPLAGTGGFSPSGGFGSSGGAGVPAGFGSFGSPDGSGGFAGSSASAGGAGGSGGMGGDGGGFEGGISGLAGSSFTRQSGSPLANRIPPPMGLTFTDASSTSQLNQTTASGGSASIPATSNFASLSSAVMTVNSVDVSNVPETGALTQSTYGTGGSLTGFTIDPTLFFGATTASTVCTFAQCPQGDTIRWGVWSIGTATISGMSSTVSSSSPLHYIVGLQTTGTQFGQLSGTATYTPTGGTTPMGSDGLAYTATIGNIAVNFTGGTASLSSYAVSGNGVNTADLTFNNVTLTLAGSGAAPKTFSGAQTILATGNSLSISGFFAGNAAQYIGAGVKVLNNTGWVGTTITQVQAFKK